ncbi:2OG-Fe(II) oxygenase [Tolypothrix sp. PCC 7910]|uniref:2OG-Fe(II) oxygenase n=1 Tax=Tolypothrix sp. PCC 7910 TaxID=2099387 RepID=UPI0014279E00|nr:2OG-Fe(II) oxygenase [Tolypothrix sp. PCC 7910]QIR35385.1 2OG-Fe(II) oxygenase [Tolypothrix sp. PCC 7910]
MSTMFKKVQNKFLRNIYNLPFLQHQAEIEYQKLVKMHIANLPLISAKDKSIVETLNSEGVVITSLAELGISSANKMFQSAQNLMHKISHSIIDDRSGFSVHATSQQMMKHPEIFLWGLEQRLINIVENYLSLPVAYHGAYFRRDIANQVVQKSRLWHIDKEDRKVLKIIVYLHDMNEDTGPFQYLPIPITESVAHLLKYHHGYIQDRTMQQVISPFHYKSCIGPAGTVVFAATGSIFHRGKLPVKSDRFAIFFDYTSRKQKLSFYSTSSLPKEDIALLAKNLSEKQKEYLLV